MYCTLDPLLYLCDQSESCANIVVEINVKRWNCASVYSKCSSVPAAVIVVCLLWWPLHVRKLESHTNTLQNSWAAIARWICVHQSLLWNYYHADNTDSLSFWEHKRLPLTIPAQPLGLHVAQQQLTGVTVIIYEHGDTRRIVSYSHSDHTDVSVSCCSTDQKTFLLLI